jgi:membrane-bound metal-dependent hydrolase YbcI (DUF457 family)
MTGRTHDLAAFTTITILASAQALPHMSLATAFVAFSANMIGGLTPDMDQSTGALWHKVTLGTVIGKFVAPVFDGHRHISHSILGLIIFGILAKILLAIISGVLLVDMNIVWWSFMLGVLSHLIMDTFTHDGVPYFFPIPLHLGIPPIKVLRMHTGGIIEKGIVFPGLFLLNMYLFYAYHAQIINFLRHSIG